MSGREKGYIESGVKQYTDPLHASHLFVVRALMMKSMPLLTLMSHLALGTAMPKVADSVRLVAEARWDRGTLVVEQGLEPGS